MRQTLMHTSKNNFIFILVLIKQNKLKEKTKHYMFLFIKKTIIILFDKQK